MALLRRQRIGSAISLEHRAGTLSAASEDLRAFTPS